MSSCVRLACLRALCNTSNATAWWCFAVSRGRNPETYIIAYNSVTMEHFCEIILNQASSLRDF